MVIGESTTKTFGLRRFETRNKTFSSPQDVLLKLYNTKTKSLCPFLSIYIVSERLGRSNKIRDTINMNESVRNYNN